MSVKNYQNKSELYLKLCEVDNYNSLTTLVICLFVTFYVTLQSVQKFCIIYDIIHKVQCYAFPLLSNDFVYTKVRFIYLNSYNSILPI